MRMRNAAIAVISFTALLFAATDRLDGIVATVGDEVILQSELDAYTMLKLNALNIKVDSTFDVKKYRAEFLQDLVDGKVLLVHAKQDSTISVTNDDVEKALDNHLNMIMRQNGWSQEALDAQIKAQGMTITKFKTETRKAIREQLYKQKIQQSYYQSIKVNRRDVEEFYKQYKDSLPPAGESVVLYKLSLRLTASDAVRQAAYDKIKSVYQRLTNGADFSELAKQYSESPEGAQGGDLGLISKGSLSELKFEEKAFALKPGQTSEPFETRLGFHILKVTEKRDQMVHIYQIYIKVAPPEDQIEKVNAQLDSIRANCTKREDFIKVVKKYSTDNVTKARDGRMGWTMLAELPASIRDAIDTLKSGDITKPVRDENTLTIYRIDSRVPNRLLTIEDDYTLLSEKTRDILAQKKLIDIVKKWRQEIFIDVRL